MSDIAKTVTDPDFMGLPMGEQVKVLSTMDQDFAGLPAVEQAKTLRSFRQPSTIRSVFLGFGKGLSDPIQGLKQRGAEWGQSLGLVSPETAQDVQEGISNRENTYRSLVGDSTAAKIGQTAGDITSTAFIPGGLSGSIAKRMATSALGGGVAGYLQPTTEDESPLMNALKVGGLSAVGTGGLGTYEKLKNTFAGRIAKPDEIVAGIRGANQFGEAVDLTRKDIAELSKKYDIFPTYGESTGSSFSKKMEILGERFPSVFGINQYRKGVSEAADSAAYKAVEQYMFNPNAADKMAANRAFASSIYDDLRKIISKVPIQEIQPAETKAIASKLLDRYPDMFGFSQDAKMKNILDQVVRGTEDLKIQDQFGNVTTKPKTFTFDDLWMLREGLGDAIGQARNKISRGDVSAKQVGELRQLFGAVSRDMDNWADSIGQPGIKETFKAANEAYRHYVVKYDIMQRAYDEATVSSGKGSREYFSPQVFANKLRNIVYKDKELKRFTTNELTEMAGLANIMQVVKRSGQYATEQNNGIQALTLGVPLSVGATIGSIAGGGIPGAVAGAGAVALGAGTLRFLTTTKPGKALLMSSSRIDPGSYSMKMLLNTIERNGPRALGFYPSNREN
jgi:hypothetical protein